ncbi:uncharacterized protein LOC119651130 [Hermetia illucens]|uniref:uncharacterized protein LOC119651130 n=1 Tax=Hermetia illucens TaxID=343691 RepID=UPI0018CC1BB1|nr:uncharacterized protein LOC119651130 [Hermetia illucens]
MIYNRFQNGIFQLSREMESSRQELKSILANLFQKCSDDWITRWHMPIIPKRTCFEGCIMLIILQLFEAGLLVLDLLNTPRGCRTSEFEGGTTTQTTSQIC